MSDFDDDVFQFPFLSFFLFINLSICLQRQLSLAEPWVVIFWTQCVPVIFPKHPNLALCLKYSNIKIFKYLNIPKTPKPGCLPQFLLAVLAQMWRGLEIQEGSMPAASFPRADDRQGRGDQPGPHQDGHPGLHQDGHPGLHQDDRPHHESDQNMI